MAVAHDLLDAFDGCVFFVDLAPLRSPVSVLPAMVKPLGGRIRRNESVLDGVAARLRSRRALLVLDTFERVMAAASQVADLLAACPRIKILVTSQTRLRLRWEHQWPVAPLILPGGGPIDPPALMENPAVALFVARAIAAQPGFALTADNAGTVAAICAGVDGLPLAIELAAAHLRLLTPQEILRRLRSRLDLLAAGALDHPARHRSLRAAIDACYDLLPDEERRVLRRLSVFVGGFTIEAAEAVSVDGPEPAAATVHALGALVDRGLLLRQPGQPGDDQRHAMLDTIREYASGQLAASGEARSARARCTAYFISLAERAESEVRGYTQQTWLDRLEAEHDNFREVLRWLLDSGEAEAGLRIAAALSRFWERRGHAAEGRTWLEAILATGETAPPGVRAKAMNSAGNLARVQGDYAGARAHYERSLALARALQDTPRIAAVLNNLGAVAKEQGDYDLAREFYEQSLVLKRGLPSRWSLALTLSNLGVVQTARGDPAAGRASLGESLELFREIQDAWGTALATNNLGTAARVQGDFARATELHANSLALRRGVRDRWGIAECLEGLARVAGARGFDERCVHLLAAASRIRDILSFPLPPDEAAQRDVELAVLRANAGDAAFDAWWASGRAMSADEACEYAIHPLSAGTGPVARPTGVPPAPRDVHIRLLGRFEVVVNGQVVPEDAWGRPQAVAILQYLLLHRSRAVPVDELVDTFWPGAASVNQTSLYTLLSRIRRGLTRLGLDPLTLQKDRTGYRLALPAHVVLDVDVFEHTARSAEPARNGGGPDDIQALADALQLFKGDLLADAPYADWCARRRESLRRLWMNATLRVARDREAHGRIDDAVAHYTAVIDYDPLCEAAHCGLMRCFARAGRRDQALRQYRLCAQALADDLDVQPSDDTQALHEAIRRGDAVPAPAVS
jgi:predicted ATPase/DNA-binding SARP family transcriptional activator